MTITRVEKLLYGVENMESGANYYRDWGVEEVESGPERTIFRTRTNQTIELRLADDPSLPDEVRGECAKFGEVLAVRVFKGWGAADAPADASAVVKIFAVFAQPAHQPVVPFAVHGVQGPGGVAADDVHLASIRQLVLVRQLVLLQGGEPHEGRDAREHVVGPRHEPVKVEHQELAPEDPPRPCSNLRQI